MNHEKITKLITRIEKTKDFDMGNPRFCCLGKAWKWYMKQHIPLDIYHLTDSSRIIKWFSNYFGIDEKLSRRLYASTSAKKADVLSFLKVVSGYYTY